MLEAMAIRDGEGRARGGEAARPGDDLRRLTDERTERLAAAEAALREARDACRRGEAERDILIDFLRRANACTTTEMLLQMAVVFFQEQAACEAVGIRLKSGGDYPYQASLGFDKPFLDAERSLCGQDGADACHNLQGLCGQVIRGRLPFGDRTLTAHGSFWSNDTRELLVAPGLPPQALRGRCILDGYRSLALIPVFKGEERIGLLQLNARRVQAFRPEAIALWERLADEFAVAVLKLQAEAELRESRETLIRAQEATQVGTWRLNAQTGELVWSDGSGRLFGADGRPPTTLDGLLERVHPGDRAAMAGQWAAARRGGRVDLEHRMLVDGGIRWIHARAELAADGGGALTGGFGILHDITQRRTDAAVRARYELIAQHARDPLLLIDLDGRIVEVNQAAVQLYGYTREELQGLKLHALRQDDAEVVDLQIEQARTAGLLAESVHICKDGSIVPVEISARLVTVEGREMLLSVIRDIRQRRETEATLRRAKVEAERANRAKSAFLAAMSHELRTPLNAILGFSQLLQQPRIGPLSDKQRQYVADIHDSGRHLLSLIDDLLDLSTIEAGRLEPRWSRFPVAPLLEQCVHLLRESCRQETLSLDLALDPVIRELDITADERRVRQIVCNLLSNAVKFTPTGGAIRLEARLTEEPEPRLEVSVSDTGIGIAPAHQPHVFDAFYQVRHGPVDKTPGSGLGLCLVSRFVHLHGGRVRVASDGEGCGSRFTFTLPLDARAGATAAAAEGRAP
jgi:PAS domain S-box-containing protein